MARIAIPAVGAVIGFFVGGPTGAQIGWALGSAVAMSMEQTTQQGPQIGEIAQQTSREGTPVPIVFGISPPIAGNIIYASEPNIVRRQQTRDGVRTRWEEVYRTYAIGVCEGPIDGFRRVWRNGILVYDVAPNSQLTDAENSLFLEKARFFNGEFTQAPSVDIEAIASPAPAHRGTAYMVIVDEELSDLRGAIPQYNFQVERTGSPTTAYLLEGLFENPANVSQFLLDADFSCIAALSHPVDEIFSNEEGLVSWVSPDTQNSLFILPQVLDGTQSIPSGITRRVTTQPPFRTLRSSAVGYLPYQTSPNGIGTAAANKLILDGAYMLTTTRGTLGVYKKTAGDNPTWTSLSDIIFNGNVIEQYTVPSVPPQAAQPGSWADVTPDGQFVAITRSTTNFVGDARLTLYKLNTPEDWQLTDLSGTFDPTVTSYAVHFVNDQTLCVVTPFGASYDYRMERSLTPGANGWGRIASSVWTTPTSTWGNYFVSSSDRKHLFMATDTRAPYLIWGVLDEEFDPPSFVQQAALPDLASAAITQMTWSDDDRYLLIGQKDSGLRVYERNDNTYTLKTHLILNMNSQNAPDLQSDTRPYGARLRRVNYPFRISAIDRACRMLALEYRWTCADYGDQSIDGSAPVISNWGTRAPRGSMFEYVDDATLDFEANIEGPVTSQYAIEVKANRNGPSTNQVTGTELADATTGTVFFFVRLSSSPDADAPLFVKGTSTARIAFGHRNGRFFVEQRESPGNISSYIRRTYTVNTFAMDTWHLVMYRQRGDGEGVSISVNNVAQAVEVNAYAGATGTTQQNAWFNETTTSTIHIGEAAPTANRPAFRICQIGVAVNRILSDTQELQLRFAGDV